MFLSALIIAAAWFSAPEEAAARVSHAADLSPRPQRQRCDYFYAGRCDPDTPCYRSDLKNWRYGDARDFECFILDER